MLGEDGDERRVEGDDDPGGDDDHGHGGVAANVVFDADEDDDVDSDGDADTGVAIHVGVYAQEAAGLEDGYDGHYGGDVADVNDGEHVG